VISGYLISRILLVESSAQGIGFFSFYARRILRIFPALILVLVACLFAGWHTLLADEYKQLGRHVGNPPDKPKAPEVEFSKKEVLREEVKIYRQPDHGCLEAC
jgi:hypothetical protein